MARFKAVILPGKDDSPDKKLPLYMRVTNMRVPGYIPLKWYVCDNDFNHEEKSGKMVRTELKDRKLRLEVDKLREEMEKLYKEMFGLACHFSGSVLASKLEAKIIADSLKTGEINGKLREDLVEKTIEAGCYEMSAQSIDFISEFNDYIDYKKAHGKKGPAQNYQTSLNHLLAYINKELPKDKKIDTFPIANITYSFLRQFEIYLRDECHKKKCDGKRCISLTMSCVRKIFNNCLDKYNDEEQGKEPIKHYPFKKYKIIVPVSQWDRGIDIENFRKILRAKPVNKRDILAQKVFTLSAYLLGMHCADFYNVEKFYQPGKATYKNGRLSYKRSKTRETRQDGAFITFRVPKEVKGLIDEFLDKDPASDRLFIFHKLYTDLENFRRAVNVGLAHLAKIYEIDEDLYSYTARCSLARYAEEDLGIPKSDIALFMNHSSEYKTTEIYTKKNFKKLDALVLIFVNYINSDLELKADLEKNPQTKNEDQLIKQVNYKAWIA